MPGMAIGFSSLQLVCFLRGDGGSIFLTRCGWQDGLALRRLRRPQSGRRACTSISTTGCGAAFQPTFDFITPSLPRRLTSPPRTSTQLQGSEVSLQRSEVSFGLPILNYISIMGSLAINIPIPYFICIYLMIRRIILCATKYTASALRPTSTHDNFKSTELFPLIKSCGLYIISPIKNSDHMYQSVFHLSYSLHVLQKSYHVSINV